MSFDLTKFAAVRKELETLIDGEGAPLLAVLQAEVATGQLTGVLAPLQPEFATVKAVVNFLSLALRLKTILGI